MLNRMSEGYKSNRNVFYACHYHVVWCPNYRRKVLLPPIEERLKQMIGEGCEEHQAEIEELEVMPDHVHLFQSLLNQHSSPDEVGQGPFLSFLASEFPMLKRKLPPLWTNSYFCATSRRRTTLADEAVH